MKVAVSVAHSEMKPGACHGGACEHGESLVWSLMVTDKLADPIECVMVQGESLTEKVAIVNEKQCDLALEIHFNSVAGGGVSGSETLYYPGSERGKEAAIIMQKHVVAAMQNPNRGVKEGWYKQDRPGIVDWYGDEDGDETPLYFLKATNCPALILEPEFIQQYGHIKNSRHVATEAIAKGIFEILDLWELEDLIP